MSELQNPNLIVRKVSLSLYIMYCSVLFLLVTCTLCVAQQQQNATLPVTFPARSMQGQQQGVCPAQNDRQAERSNITGTGLG